MRMTVSRVQFSISFTKLTGREATTSSQKGEVLRTMRKLFLNINVGESKSIRPRGSQIRFLGISAEFLDRLA